jgi:hypothetical protein
MKEHNDSSRIGTEKRMNDNEFDNVDENKQKPQQMNFS